MFIFLVTDSFVPDIMHSVGVLKDMTVSSASICCSKGHALAVVSSVMDIFLFSLLLYSSKQITSGSVSIDSRHLLRLNGSGGVNRR